MESQIDLRELLPEIKGAPLSILLFLSMNGNRAVTVTDLSGKTGTGFSAKPVRAGLALLREKGLITEPQRNRYQLTGKDYQLPLYWDERILPAGEPFRYRGDSPDLERRVAALEAAVFPNKTRETPALQGDSPVWKIEGKEDLEVIDEPRSEYSGNTAGKMGVFPIEGRISRNPVVSGKWSEKTEAGETPVEMGETPEVKGESPEPVNEDETGKEEEAGESPQNQGETPTKKGNSPELLINNINNIQVKEVSKYVNKPTYLLNNQSNEVNSLTGKGETPEQVGESPEKAGEIPEAVETNWKTVLSQLKGMTDQNTFSTIFRHAEILSYADSHYIISLNDKFSKDFAEARLKEPIENILKTLEHGEVSVSFVVGKQSQDEEKLKHMRRHKWLHDESKYDAPSLELLPVPADPKAAKLTEICNDYLLDPVGVEYTMDELRELIRMDPDPDVLRFTLPRLSGYNAVKVWCEKSKTDPSKLKRWLLTYYKITGTAVDSLEKNESVSFKLIVSVCSDQGIESEGTTDQMRGRAIWLIDQFAKSAGPQ